MTEKEIYIIVGKLACHQYKSVFFERNMGYYGTNGYDAFILPHELAKKIQLYLQELPFDYEFVDKILSKKASIYAQDYRGKMKCINDVGYYVDIDCNTGRFSISAICECSTCWLDKYKQTWWLKEDIKNK